MDKLSKVKRSSNKVFSGSPEQSQFGEGYYLHGDGSSYGKKDDGSVSKDSEYVDAPYSEEVYLPRDRQVVNVFLSALPNIHKVLVLGCARGYMVQAFREKGVEAFGVDISEWAISNGAETVKEHLYCGDICDLSMWEDNEFDLVVALDVLEHIHVPDLYTAIKEATRVGKNVVLDVPTRPNDDDPDQSHGTDKTHVSIYSKDWWVTEFMHKGVEPIHVQEYLYPQVRADSPWEDNHDHAVTIYFTKPRPLPTVENTVQYPVKEGGKDFKILWWSNAHWAGTGYGLGTKHVVYKLNEYYDTACLASYGLEGGALSFNGMKVFPRLFDPYGIDAAELICRNWEPDIMITLFDIWIGSSGLMRGERDWFKKIHPYWVPYFPVDHDPVPIPTLEQAQQAFKCVSMSRFGREQLRKKGLGSTYIPHGVDTKVFAPPEDKKANKKWLYERVSAPMYERNKLPWDDETFVIGKNAANKDTKRKNYDRDFKAINIFFEQNPDAKKDTRIHLHTIPTFPGGFPLNDMADMMGVGQYMRRTHPFQMYCGMSEANMAKMYGAFDVYLGTARNEGFGIPLIESQACGVPVISTDFTSMTELVGKTGWLVKPITTDTTMLLSEQAIPNEWEIVEYLEEAYNSPDKVKKKGEKSRKFSLDYDWEKVIQPLWVNLIEEIREEMRPKTHSERRIQV